MKLIADSGSTKTQWQLFCGNNKLRDFITDGCNPYQMTLEDIRQLISKEVLPALAPYRQEDISHIQFFGAGCTSEKIPLMKDVFLSVFTSVESVDVDSDMLGAAKSLFGESEGIACILGTGANSCLYDGVEIIQNTPAMGFILGDEGSGAVLGRTFLNAIYKGNHEDEKERFEKETGLTLGEIIQRVYREPLPNRFLASLAPYIRQHISESWMDAMVEDCFCQFFQKNIQHYKRKDLPVSFVGSIAWHFREQLARAAQKEGYTIGTIKKGPLE